LKVWQSGYKLTLLKMADDIKVAVLEQKLLDFNNVVEKLDAAISKISEVNSNISRMLAVHEERIEQCNKSDDLLVKMIDDVKKENAEDHKKSNDRITVLEKEVEDVSRIKWMTIGCGIVLTVLAASMSTLASGWWTPAGMQDAQNIIQRSK
jgi:hypothetical protein